MLEHDFAVILLDVQMSEMNGIETAVAIRERERSRHIPIIFLTGRGTTDEMMFKGYSAGAVDYLMKPIRPEILRPRWRSSSSWPSPGSSSRRRWRNGPGARPKSPS